MVALQVSIDLRQARALMGRLSRPELGRRGRAAMQESLEVVQREIQANTPVYHGALRQGIHVEIHGTTLDSLRGQVLPARPTLTYAMVVEEGRKPGSRPPPSQAIAGWVAAKLGPGVSAFVVARSIGRKGTKGKKMFQKGGAKARAQVGAIFLKHFRSIG